MEVDKDGSVLDTITGPRLIQNNPRLIQNDSQFLVVSCLHSVLSQILYAKGKGKGKSIVANTDYTTLGCGAHLPFHGLEPAVGLHPVMDSRPHLFHNLPLPPSHTGTKLYCLVTEAHRCE